MKKLPIILALTALFVLALGVTLIPLEAQDLRDIASLLDTPGADPSGTTDSSAAIQTAWNAQIANAYGGTVLIPCGNFMVAHTVKLSSSFLQSFTGSGSCTQFFWVGNATDPMFLVINCDACRIGNFYTTNLTASSAKTFWQVQLSSQPRTSSQTVYHDIVSQSGGTFAAPNLTTFFYAGCTGYSYGGTCIDGNNDQMSFEDVHVYGASRSAFTFDNTQIFDVNFDHSSFLDAYIGVEAKAGSFKWKHSAAIGYSAGCDFFISSLTADAVFEIDGMETENSNCFLNVSSGAFPGGGLSAARVNVKLRSVYHDGLGTGCAGVFPCVPTGHYIVFDRPGILSIEDSNFNPYGFHESIFFTGAFNNFPLYGPAMFTVRDTFFGFGGTPQPNDTFGTTIADNFSTAAGGSAPTSMSNVAANNGNTGGRLQLGNYASGFAQNNLVNVTSTNTHTYNAIVDGTLTAPNIGAFTSVVGAAVHSVGTGLSDLTMGGTPQNAHASTFTTQIYSAVPLTAVTSCTAGNPTICASGTLPVSGEITLSGFPTGWAAMNYSYGATSSYVAGTTYTLGQWVAYGGTLYTALTGPGGPNTGHTPSSSPTWWTAGGATAALATGNFSVPVDSTMFGSLTGSQNWSYPGSDQWIWLANGGGIGGGSSSLTGASCAVSGAGTLASPYVYTVTATDAAHGLVQQSGVELVTVTLAMPTGYDVSLAPVTYLNATQFSYVLPGASSCPTAWTSGGTVVPWVGPFPALGGFESPQNLAILGNSNVGWSGPTVQFASQVGHTALDTWTSTETLYPFAPGIGAGANGGAAGNGQNFGAFSCGNPNSTATPAPCLGGGNGGGGPHLTQHQHGFGVAYSSGISTTTPYGNGSDVLGPDVQSFDTLLGFNPWVPTEFSALASCSSLNYGALVNINDLTGALTIGATATGTGTATAVSNLLACNGSNWIVATGSSPGALGITALTGDGTATGPGSVAFTLAAVGSAGSCGSTTTSCGLTFDAKGRETARSSNTIASVTVSPGTGMSGGGAVAPGGTITLTNAAPFPATGITHTSTLPCAGTQVFTNGLLTSVTGTC